MAIIKTNCCSHCGKPVPNRCDGKLYYIKQWGRNRVICKGSNGSSFYFIDRKFQYKLVRGHGDWCYVDLIPLIEEIK